MASSAVRIEELVIVKRIALVILENDESSSSLEAQTRKRTEGSGTEAGGDVRQKTGWSGFAGDTSPVLYVYLGSVCWEERLEARPPAAAGPQPSDDECR
jgi:hypothetical protein